MLPLIALLLIFLPNSHALEITSLNTTARNFSLAGTPDITTVDGESLNPASIAFSRQIEMSATTVRSLVGTGGNRFHITSIGTPMAYSVTYFNYNYGSVDAVDETGTKEGTLNPQDTALSLTLAGPMGQESLGWGVKVNRFQRTLDEKASGTGMDIGIVQKNWIAPEFNFGISYLNLFQKLNWEKITEKTPRQLSLQAMYEARVKFLIAYIQENSRWRHSIGAEFPWNGFSARVGMVSSKNFNSQASYRWGFGAVLGNLKVDWGSAFMDALGNINVASITYLF